VEIDHTPLDLIVVDLDDRLPLGRPTMTLAVDVFSGFPVGLYVGFERPSYLAVMYCLRHGILPKPNVQKLYGTRHPWPVMGLWEKLVTDNGKDFTGANLDDTLAQLGIVRDFAPVGHPWFKGTIERRFRSQNTGLIHGLPGTTFSNMVQRGDYDSGQHACVSLDAFWKILHIYLLDIYTQQHHDAYEGLPAQV